jgi:hypothetical protein
MKRVNAGQSTLEYVIILAAVVGAIVLVATNFLKPKLTDSYDTLTTTMQDKVETVNFSGE